MEIFKVKDEIKKNTMLSLWNPAEKNSFESIVCSSTFSV